MIGENNPMFGKTHSKETRQKISQNLPDFSGSKNHNFGKSISEEQKRKISKTLSKSYYILDPCGKLILVDNVRDFCLQNGLDQVNIYAVISGKSKSYKDYIKPLKLRDHSLEEMSILKAERKRNTGKHLIKEFTFIKDGKILSAENLQEFCKHNGLRYRGMVSAYHGYKGRTEYKGYVSGKHLDNDDAEQLKLAQKTV